MADGTQVGSGYIEITPEINTAAMKKARTQIKQHLEAMGREADKTLKEQNKDLMGNFSKQVEALQKGKTKGVFDQQRKEMQAFQSLDRQRKAAMEADKKRMADEIKNIQYLKKLKDNHFESERRDQQRRLNELSQWYQKKQAIEKADAAEAAKASKQAASDMDKAFKYRTMRGLGASPEQAAAYATGQSPAAQAGKTVSALGRIPKAAQAASSGTAAAFERISHHLSQLSTRIGLASFQLQLLGGFATTFLTGPAAYMFGTMARDGLKFAANIDYARASMKALLGPSTDVEKVISDIRKMAIESPLFNTEDAISYAQKLASVGVKGKDLYKSMQALSNIMLTQGVAGPERANLAMMAYTQILSKGTIGMDDLRQQFAEHVPGGMKVFEQAAKILGYKTLDDLRDAMKSGEVSAAELNQAFITLGNSPKYLQGATNAAETLGGVWQAFNEEMQSAIGMAFDKNRKQIIAAINEIRPVAMSFINWVVANIPVMIYWLGRVIDRIKDIKAQYDSLNPAQKEQIRQIVLLGLAAGPAAVAVGILGTALSGVANAASLTMKSLSLVGSSLRMGWVSGVAAALLLVAQAMVYLYNHSESFRLKFLQVMNLLKDFAAKVVVPVIDLLIGSFKSLGGQLEAMGLKTEHLAYVAGLLVIPLAAIAVSVFALYAAVKIVQAGLLILSAVLYGLLSTISMLLWGLQQLYQGLSHLPGDAGKFFGKVAESVENSRKKLEGFVDVNKQWHSLTSANTGTLGGLTNQMNQADLTVTGLTGGFNVLGHATDLNIQKQFSLADAVNNARAAMESQASATRSAMDASDNYSKSMISLKESVKANGKTLNEHSRQGQANRDMLKQATQASYEMMLQDIKSGVPMDQAIKRHKDRTEALKNEFGKNKETRAEADKLIASYGKVPKDVATLLKLIGWDGTAGKLQQILAAQKVAANPGMSYDKALQSERKAWQIRNYATGGLISGPGGPTEDRIPIMASDQEYMIRANSANKLGKPILDYINKHGELPVQQYAKGGPVTWPFDIDISKTKFPELIGGGPNGGAMGWQKMMAILRRQFPGLPLISGYRPGAMTSTGNRSYHALGRAVDLPPRWDVFNWISQNYGRGTKELIYTPAGGRQIKNGQNHVFTGGTIQEDHYNHVHWAYDNGGSIAPNQPFINKTGANELALNSAQGKALEEKIANSDRPVNVTVYVDGVKRDAEIVWEEKADALIRSMGGV